jgi:predicted alpha/beta hydrolase
MTRLDPVSSLKASLSLDAAATDAEVTVTPVQFAAADGYVLHGTLHAPQAPRALVVISGGTGIPHRFYRAYAESLAQAGFVVLTWDFRGVGASRPADLRKLDIDVVGWGERDQHAAFVWATSAYAGLPWFAMGHSVGFQVVALALDASIPAPMGHVSIAAGTGVWWHMPFGFAAKCVAIWYGLAPLMLATTGYLPAKKLRLGEDLPAGVAWQWRRWCCTEGYFPEMRNSPWVERFEAVQGDALALTFDDDPIANPKNVSDLHRYFSGLRFENVTIRHAWYGMRAIGHIDFFSRRMPPALWAVPRLWMERKLADAGM